MMKIAVLGATGERAASSLSSAQARHRVVAYVERRRFAGERRLRMEVGELMIGASAIGVERRGRGHLLPRNHRQQAGPSDANNLRSSSWP